MSELLINIIKIYKRLLSPVFEKLFGQACRFTPTCSEYTIMSLEKYGTLRGTLLGVKRFLRCNPFTNPGYDPVPLKI